MRLSPASPHTARRSETNCQEIEDWNPGRTEEGSCGRPGACGCGVGGEPRCPAPLCAPAPAPDPVPPLRALGSPSCVPLQASARPALLHQCRAARESREEKVVAGTEPACPDAGRRGSGVPASPGEGSGVEAAGFRPSQAGSLTPRCRARLCERPAGPGAPVPTIPWSHFICAGSHQTPSHYTGAAEIKPTWPIKPVVVRGGPEPFPHLGTRGRSLKAPNEEVPAVSPQGRCRALAVGWDTDTGSSAHRRRRPHGRTVTVSLGPHCAASRRVGWEFRGPCAGHGGVGNAGVSKAFLTPERLCFFKPCS